MKLKDLTKTVDYYSEKVSELVRKFAFAGIAIIWVFKLDSDSSSLLPKDLIHPLLFIFFSLIFDLLHYLISTLTYYIILRGHEKKGKKADDDIGKIKKENNYVGWAFWTLKLSFLIIAYTLIGCFIINKIGLI